MNTINRIGLALGQNITDDVIKKANRDAKISGQQHLEGFALIEPFLDELKKQNPGTVICVERKENSTDLKRLAVIPSTTIDALQNLLPVYGVDGAAMKPVRLLGTSTEKFYLEDMIVSVISGRLPRNTIFFSTTFLSFLPPFLFLYHFWHRSPKTNQSFRKRKTKTCTNTFVPGTYNGTLSSTDYLSF
jgi:hypothetical protein